MTEDDIIRQYILNRIDKTLYALPNVEGDYNALSDRLELTPEQEQTLNALHCIEYKALYRQGFRDCASLLLRLLAA